MTIFICRHNKYVYGITHGRVLSNACAFVQAISASSAVFVLMRNLHESELNVSHQSLPTNLFINAHRHMYSFTDKNRYNYEEYLTHCTKATMHQLTTMLATSKKCPNSRS